MRFSLSNLSSSISAPFCEFIIKLATPSWLFRAAAQNWMKFSLAIYWFNIFIRATFRGRILPTWSGVLFSVSPMFAYKIRGTNLFDTKFTRIFMWFLTFAPYCNRIAAILCRPFCAAKWSAVRFLDPCVWFKSARFLANKFTISIFPTDEICSSFLLCSKSLRKIYSIQSLSVMPSFQLYPLYSNWPHFLWASPLSDYDLKIINSFWSSIVFMAFSISFHEYSFETFQCTPM